LCWAQTPSTSSPGQNDLELSVNSILRLAPPVDRFETCGLHYNSATRMKHRFSKVSCAAVIAVLAFNGAGKVLAADNIVSAPDMPCDGRPYSILVLVKNVKDDKGTITIDLHGDNPDRFLKSGAKLARLRVPAAHGDMKICVPVEKAGVYALALYQDRNSNLKLDKTWIGLPDEPFGISRDAPLRMAPPKHKDAAFEVMGPVMPMTVTLRD
jgi:uncharacterized protein (DUF2141 family)